MNKKKRFLLELILLVILMSIVFLIGFLISNSTLEVDFASKNLPISIEHPFGTDQMGRDMLKRTLKAMSTSMGIGLIASVFSVIIATIVGSVSIIRSKSLDSIIKWLIDLFMSIPQMVLMIIISLIFGRGFWGTVLAISLTHWTSLARLVRSEVLEMRDEPYILISKNLGNGTGFIIRRHVLVQILPQIIVGSVLQFPHAIIHESSLSFLGFGMSPETPTIGIILSESMKYITTGNWHLAVLPGLVLFLVVLLVDRIGSCVKFLILDDEL